MGIITKVFDLIFGQFALVWDMLTGIYTAFVSLFDSFKSIFDNLFETLGIYDTIIDSLDTLTSLANNLNSLIEQNTLTSTILSFCALDTLFTVVVTTLASTFGVLLTALSFLFVTVVPVLVGFLTIKAVLRLIRLCTGGIAKP